MYPILLSTYYILNSTGYPFPPTLLLLLRWISSPYLLSFHLFHIHLQTQGKVSTEIIAQKLKTERLRLVPAYILK